LTFGLQPGHSLTIRPGLRDSTLFRTDYQRSVIDAGNNRRWRGEEETPDCVLPWYQP
jgi:hypothetical protein